MKAWFSWLVINGGFACAVWFGFVEGVQGAQYLVQFFVWAFAVPLGFAAFGEDMQKRLAAEPPGPPARVFLGRMNAWAGLGLMVWSGHIFTAAAWWFWLLANTHCNAAVKKLRDESAAKAAE